jgi:hypothetical protein
VKISPAVVSVEIELHWAGGVCSDYVMLGQVTCAVGDAQWRQIPTSQV